MTEELFFEIYGVLNDAEHYADSDQAERLAYLRRRAALLERLAEDVPGVEWVASDARDGRSGRSRSARALAPGARCRTSSRRRTAVVGDVLEDGGRGSAGRTAVPTGRAMRRAAYGLAP
jgi:hypothetical protein